MSVQPLRDLLYILPFEAEERRGSIYTSPDPSHKHRPTQGIVKYRGPLTSGEIKVGDHVVFGGYDGDVLVVEGEGALIIMPEEFIKAILLEGENHLLTLDSVKKEVMGAASRAMIREGEQHAEIIGRVRDRIIEELDGRFSEELYF